MLSAEYFGIETREYMIVSSRRAQWTFQAIIERELKRLGLGEEGEDYEIYYFWGRFNLTTPKGQIVLFVQDVWDLCSYREAYHGSHPAKWHRLFEYLQKVPDRDIKFKN